MINNHLPDHITYAINPAISFPGITARYNKANTVTDCELENWKFDSQSQKAEIEFREFCFSFFIDKGNVKIQQSILTYRGRPVREE